jgi:hypothetical protein
LRDQRNVVVAFGDVSDSDLTDICLEMANRDFRPFVLRPDLSFLSIKDDFGKITPYLRDLLEYCQQNIEADKLENMSVSDMASYWLTENNPELNPNSVFVVVIDSNRFRNGADNELVRVARESFYTSVIDLADDEPYREFLSELNMY